MIRKLASMVLASFLSLFSFVFPAAAGKTNFCGSAAVSDIVLWNPSTAYISVWCDANPDLGELLLGPWASASGWFPMGVGNFSGGPSSDIILRNFSTNEVSIWPDGNAAAGYISGTLNVAANYTILQSFGDFNGDGYDDLVVYNSSQVAVWYSGNVSTSAILGGLAPGWTPHLVADVNGDGIADLVLRNVSGGAATGLYSYWLSGNPASSAMIASPGEPWEIMALANFVTGGASCDILWYNVANGDMATSVGCNSSSVTAFTEVGILGWPVSAFMAEDITGDGRADLVADNYNVSRPSYMSGAVVSSMTFLHAYNSTLGWRPLRPQRLWFP